MYLYSIVLNRSKIDEEETALNILRIMRERLMGIKRGYTKYKRVCNDDGISFELKHPHIPLRILKINKII